jgi:hypothetical protein
MDLLIGSKHDRWTILKETNRKVYKDSSRRMFLCKCDCGVEKEVDMFSILRNVSKSCGCLNREQIVKKATTHGLRHHPLYKVWCCMKERCNNPNSEKFHIYGERGIKVCDEWETNFQQFYDDMITTWKKGLSIDRIDNNKGYSKYNCRWSTMTEQQNNRRDNKIITYDKKQYTVAELARKFNINQSTLRQRIARGMTVNQAIQKG